MILAGASLVWKFVLCFNSPLPLQDRIHVPGSMLSQTSVLERSVSGIGPGITQLGKLFHQSGVGTVPSDGTYEYIIECCLLTGGRLQFCDGVSPLRRIWLD